MKLIELAQVAGISIIFGIIATALIATIYAMWQEVPNIVYTGIVIALIIFGSLLYTDWEKSK